jgi:Zn-finger nucleic acid-binding protein
MHCSTSIIAILMPERHSIGMEYGPQSRFIKQEYGTLEKRINRKEPESKKNNPTGKQAPE